MQAPELTLAAAIRDATHERAEPRNKAFRNLAAALLEELGTPGPAWEAAAHHRRGDEVTALLRDGLRDEEPMIPGLSAIGLGLLGDRQVVPAVAKWLDDGGDAGDDEESIFRRECAVIALSFVGAAAPRSRQGNKTRTIVLTALRRAMGSERADVRFQASVALVEVGGPDVESDLVTALGTETHPEVRENLVAAISRLDPPGPTACAALQAIVVDDREGPEPIGLEAALALAAARDPNGGPRLVRALDFRGDRGRALEALAALGRAAPPDAVERVHRLATSWLTPGITRVRAAYALATMMAPQSDDRDNPGLALLRRLAWHPRPAVREAVDDAHAALRKLGSC